MDCVARADGSGIELLDALAGDVAPLGGQGRPRFIPSAAGQPENCPVTPVVGPGGETIGWLSGETDC